MFGTLDRDPAIPEAPDSHRYFRSPRSSASIVRAVAASWSRVKLSKYCLVFRAFPIRLYAWEIWKCALGYSGSSFRQDSKFATAF